MNKITRWIGVLSILILFIYINGIVKNYYTDKIENQKLDEFRTFLKKFTDRFNLDYPYKEFYDFDPDTSNVIIHNRIYTIHTKNEVILQYNAEYKCFLFIFMQGIPESHYIRNMAIDLLNNLPHSINHLNGTEKEYKKMILTRITFDPRSTGNKSPRVIFSFSNEIGFYLHNYRMNTKHINVVNTTLYKEVFSRALSISYPEFANLNFEKLKDIPMEEFGILNDYNEPFSFDPPTNSWI